MSEEMALQGRFIRIHQSYLKNVSYLERARIEWFYSKKYLLNLFYHELPESWGIHRNTH